MSPQALWYCVLMSGKRLIPQPKSLWRSRAQRAVAQSLRRLSISPSDVTPPCVRSELRNFCQFTPMNATATVRMIR
jgi:hypothetical protein